MKKDELFSLFTKHKLDFCCVQETKLTSFSERDGLIIWKSTGVGWCVEDAVGRSGGLLSFWDEQKFSCSSHLGIGGAVVVNGRWRDTGDE